MRSAIKIYLFCVPVFLVCDGLWLGLIARNFYRRNLGYLFADRIVWPAALVFYLLHAAGIVYFAVLPALAEASPRKLLVSAALFGLITYATYDLTNLATVRNWPMIVSVVDMAWGVVLSLVVGLAGYWLGMRLQAG